MSGSEHQFIELCKNQIERKFAFGNGQGYSQRDLELLSDHIEQKTGVVISLSTLKRLWKENYKHSPQLATLNALVALLDYKDWQSFKLANRGRPSIDKTIAKWVIPICVSLGVGVVLIFGFAGISKFEKFKSNPIVKGPVYFEAIKTVNSGIPNTVIFKYDVSNISADTFFIQQSWNADHRVKISPTDSVLTSMYYESGFHRAKLLADDSVIAMRPVHIISNGWEPHIYRSDSDPEIVDLKNEKFTSDGQLHLDSALLLKRNIDFSNRFHTRITNSQAFDVHSDHFTFSTRMKADPVFNQVCPWMDLIIVTDINSFSVSWTGKGCEKNASYKLGEINRSGNNNDLSSLGCNVYEWQELEIQVDNRKATIFLNGKAAYQETYKKDFGKIMSLIYIFDGTGSIDYAKLSDGNGKLIFRDDFD